MKRRLTAEADVNFFGHPREPNSTFGISVFFDGEGVLQGEVQGMHLDHSLDRLRDLIHLTVRDDIYATMRG